MSITAIMPIKLNNERFPGKNTKLLGDKPLLAYELESLQKTGYTDSVNVYCSNEDVVKYLPEGIRFVKRPEYLDLPTSNFTQIFKSFMEEIDSDIYVYAHATAPYISVNTMRACIKAVISGAYDSAFCAVKIQDYLWANGKPLNFDASNIPRSQDLPVYYRETSGVYVFAKEVFKTFHRRVGENPYIHMVNFKEAVDINVPEDFKLAEILLDVDI